MDEIEGRDTASTKNIGYSDGTRDPNIPEPRLVAIAECILTDMETPAGTKINREDFGIVIVFIDIAVIISFILFIWFLERGQEAFIEKFDQ